MFLNYTLLIFISYLAIKSFSHSHFLNICLKKLAYHRCFQWHLLRSGHSGQGEFRCCSCACWLTENSSAMQPSSSERIAPVLSTWPPRGRFILTSNYNYSKCQALFFKNEWSLSHLKCKLKLKNKVCCLYLSHSQLKLKVITKLPRQ